MTLFVAAYAAPQFQPQPQFQVGLCMHVAYYLLFTFLALLSSLLYIDNFILLQ